jgi:hypothetical protein
VEVMVKIDAKGTIVNNDDKWIYDWFGYDAFCPKDIDKLSLLTAVAVMCLQARICLIVSVNIRVIFRLI